MEEKQSNGLAIASMVLGIVSLILTCILPYVSWVLAIVGIVLAAIAKKKAKSGMATAGLVCSIIALAVWVVVIILLCICRIGRIKKNGQQAGNCKSSLPLLFFLVLY